MNIRQFDKYNEILKKTLIKAKIYCKANNIHIFCLPDRCESCSNYQLRENTKRTFYCEHLNINISKRIAKNCVCDRYKYLYR